MDEPHLDSSQSHILWDIRRPYITPAVRFYCPGWTNTKNRTEYRLELGRASSDFACMERIDKVPEIFKGNHWNIGCPHPSVYNF